MANTPGLLSGAGVCSMATSALERFRTAIRKMVAKQEFIHHGLLVNATILLEGTCDVMYWIVWAIVGLIVWGGMNYFMSGKIGGKGWWISLVAALLGSWLGDFLLGDWVWVVAGFNVLAGAIGAIVLTWLWSLVDKSMNG